MVKVLVDGFDACAAARRVKLLCLDLDGTLVDPSKQVTPAVRAALARAQEARLSVALATGRHPFNVEELQDELGLSHDAVCLSGALALRHGEVVFTHGLAYEAACAAIDAAERCGAYISIAGADFNLTGGHIDRGPGGVTPAMQRYVACGSYDELRHEAAAREGRMLKASLHGETPAAYEKIRAALGKLSGVEVAQSDKLWVDVTAAGCSKAEGIAALAGAMGYTLDEVAAVGDDENDVASLGAVGLGIAMGNALPVARAVAKMAVADNAHDGVAEAIDFILDAQRGDSPEEGCA